jgi:hypothetical protein
MSTRDADLLDDILDRWDELSMHPDATHCMTDHCHVELEEGRRIANWLRKDGTPANKSE